MDNLGKWFLVAMIGLVSLSFLFQWFEKRDKELMDWAELYEACVLDEYKTTPWEYRNENGEYPECDVTINFEN